MGNAPRDKSIKNSPGFFWVVFGDLGRFKRVRIFWVSLDLGAVIFICLGPASGLMVKP
jgi:hypothetical protein